MSHPPWSLKGVHWDLLLEGRVVFRMKGKTCRKDKEEDKFRRMLYVNPARSYESGKGTDMIYVHLSELSD
jgi:hypothetical protein